MPRASQFWNFKLETGNAAGTTMIDTLFIQSLFLLQRLNACMIDSRRQNVRAGRSHDPPIRKCSELMILISDLAPARAPSAGVIRV